MGLFGEKKKDPREQVREMQSRIKKEMRKLDRDVGHVQRSMQQQEAEIKKYGKSGNIDAAKIIAKELINARKAVSRLYSAKAEMNSVVMNMNHQASMVKMAGNMQRSTEVMKCMSSLVKIPEIQATMRDLSKEMMKAGIMEEMMEDTFEGLEDSEDMEEAAQSEVDKILFEVTAGAIGQAPDAVAENLPEPKGAAAAAAPEEDDDLTEMQARLEQLRS